jgi:hypothetical protein
VKVRKEGVAVLELGLPKDDTVPLEDAGCKKFIVKITK